jgi:monothiol glutaredoxin
MGIVDRIKRRLPILGAGSPPQPPAPRAPVRTEIHHTAPPEDDRFKPTNARGDVPVAQYVEETVKNNDIVLFMKGSPLSPQCGFSAGASGILAGYGRSYAHVNVLADPEVREAVKAFTNWPTIPQVFIGGEFVGGADILKELHDSGELKGMIDKLPTKAEA